MIKVLIVDDSALMRLIIKEILEKDPEIMVVDTGRDGKEALEKAKKLRPDVITMDVNMPGMDGLSALEKIKEKRLGNVLMLSSETKRGAEVTLRALELGAFDFVTKPQGLRPGLKDFEEELISKVKAVAGTKGPSRESPVKMPDEYILSDGDMKAVVIGISTGGPKSIMKVLPYLPPRLNAAVFLVQHMPPAFTGPFAQRLDQQCAMKVVEAEDGMEIKPGICYVGKGGYNLLVAQEGKKKKIVLTDSPKHRFMPSADVTMESVLSLFGKDTVGVLMTGMGDDGADAMVKIRKAGGRTIAESPETAVIFGMPRAAIERNGAEFVLPNYEIASKIIELVGVRKEEEKRGRKEIGGI